MADGQKRAAIYARVSTREQSPQMQLDALREFAARRELDVMEEFVDVGVSGTKDTRPELSRLMDAARKRKLDVILVYRFDRFARSVKHLVTALAEFQELGVEFVSYSENFDTSTPIGRAMFSIVGALVELERDLIVERSVEGQRRARARGARIGRPRREVNVERLAALRAEGKSIREIARAVGVSKSVVGELLAARPETPRAEARLEPA